MFLETKEGKINVSPSVYLFLYLGVFMSKCQKCNDDVPFVTDKKMMVLYSLYLALAAIAWYVFVTTANTAIIAVMWKYSMMYDVNTFLFAGVLFISGLLLIFTCLGMIRGKSFVRYTGLAGSALLFLYPLYLLVFDTYVPYAYLQMLLVIIPAIIMFIITLLLWKKYS